MEHQRQNSKPAVSVTEEDPAPASMKLAPLENATARFGLLHRSGRFLKHLRAVVTRTWLVVPHEFSTCSIGKENRSVSWAS